MENNRKTDPELGLFFYNAIRKSGYTMEKIAEELNVSRESVNLYCSGKRKSEQRRLLRFIRIAGVRAEDTPFLKEGVFCFLHNKNTEL